MSINRVTISGNLTRDPEVRSTAGGTAVMKFGIAVNDRRKDAEGNWVDYANFVECTLFGARATALESILHKGMKVCIDGKLQYSSWEDRETHKNRSKIEVIVNELDLMSSRNGSQPASNDASTTASVQVSVPTEASASSSAGQDQTDSASFDADIPF